MMRGIFNFLRSCFVYAVIAIALVFGSPICFIIACLPFKWRHDNRVYYTFLALFYRLYLKATFLNISVSGTENIPAHQAIIVANHQSSLDIPLLGSLVGFHPHVWLFLARFSKIPYLGFIARRMNIVVDHSGLRKLVGSVGQASDILKRCKSHVLMFPEGGRYIDGKIHKFYNGFARLAKETNRIVIPVFMRNVNKVYPPKSFLFQPYDISIIIGEPFVLLENESEIDFVKRVHDWFVAQETN